MTPPSDAGPTSVADTTPDTQPQGRSNDLVAGAVFAGIGVLFVVPSVGYGLGSFAAMGPGMFPFLLGMLLVGLGVAIAVAGLRGGEDSPGLGRFPWRGAACLLGAMVWFAYTITPLGMLVATFGTALLACLASSAVTVRRALVTSVCIVVATYVIFVLALQLRLPLYPA